MKNVKRLLSRIISLVIVMTMLNGCAYITPLVSLNEIVDSYDDEYAKNENEDIDDDDDDTEPEQPNPSWDTEIEPVEPDVAVEPDVPMEPDEMDAQTIMIYMVGSDLESYYGSASADLEEIMDAGVDTEHNNIVVYTGGASEWQMNGIPDYENSILLLNDAHEFEVIYTTSLDNMGEADTLSNFINYCYDNFDSESYSLILWNHGAGPVYGFGVDENYMDILTMDEMKIAFEDSVGQRNKRLEWVGFDACLMNSLEFADLLEPYANYMIASQETEPGWGWNYDFLSITSDKPLTGEEMGKEIVDTYMEYGEFIFDISPRYYCDLTLSCIDLKQYGIVESALNKCFAELGDGLNIDTYPNMVRGREKTRAFGVYATSFDYGMVDAMHLLKLISGNTESAVDVIEALQDMVVYSKTNMKNAYGISICYPYASGSDYADACVAFQEYIDFSSDYVGFLKKFYTIQNGDTLFSDWNFKNAVTGAETIESTDGSGVDTSDLSLQLTEEQQNNYADADFFILAKAKDAGFITEENDERAEEIYMFIHFGQDVTVDENGVLHGYYGNKALYLYDETEASYSSIPFILIEEDSTEEEERYISNVILGNYSVDDLSLWEMEAAELQIVVNDEYPDGIIRSAVPLSDEEEISPSKQLLELDDFTTLSVVSRGSYFTRGENGEMLNFYSWENSGWMLGFEQELTNDYHLEMRPLDNPENYVCMFRIKDLQGNYSYSELIPLK